MPEVSKVIFTLVGSNRFILLHKKKQILKDFCEKYGDLSVENISPDRDLDSIKSSVLNLPFLVEKKLVVIDEPSTNKDLVENLIGWLDNLGEKTDVLIIEPNPDKRTSWYKFLQKNTELILCEEFDEASMRRWVAEVVNQKNGTINNEAIKQLVNNSGLNQQQLYNDIEKLLNFSSSITVDSVNLLVEPVPQDTVFTLLEALVNGDSSKTFTLYESLKQAGVDANEIIAMLGWQMHTLLLVKSSLTDKKEGSGLHPYVIQKNTFIAKNLTFKEIEELLNLVTNAELSIKKEGLSAVKVTSILFHEVISLINNKTT